jgi:hypothetical protein
MVKEYVRKSGNVKAIQYNNEMRINDCLPEGVFISPTSRGDMPVIRTEMGERIINDGDYIIIKKNGERVPCRKDLFEMIYDEIKEEI